MNSCQWVKTYLERLHVCIIDAIKKNMETLIDASKEVGLEVNPEKTKYMLLSRRQQSCDITIANRCLKMCQSSDIWERL
jgi:hypothetical protein